MKARSRANDRDETRNLASDRDAKDDFGPGPDRDETESERLDRNWAELLQELRVTQTGTQILTGFLLTIAFQSRFAELDSFQVDVYLLLVIAATLTTVLALAPVSLHRRLFRQGEKARIVALANRIIQFTLLSLAVVMVGTIMFIFDVVVGRAAGLIAGGAAAVVVAGFWMLLPRSARGRASVKP